MHRLTVAQGAAFSIVAVLGTGVIALPALAADVAGPASVLAWVTMLVFTIPLAVTFAALGSRHPDAGGVSTYVRRAFGPRSAAVIGWSFYFAVPVGAPAAGLFGGGYVADLVGGGRTTALLTAVGLLLAAVVSNAVGLRLSGRVQLVSAAVLAALLLAATLVSLPHADWQNMQPFAPNGWLAIGSAMAMIVWAFAGWEAVTSLAGEFGEPARDVPRATAITLVVVAVLYLGVVFASALVLGPAAGDSRAPLADLLALGIGEPARLLTVVAAVLLTFGAINAYVAGIGKLGAALGRDGALPAWFAQGSATGEVPRRSLAVIAVSALTAIGIAAFASVDTERWVLLTTGCFVLIYALAAAAAIRLLPKGSIGRRAAMASLAVTILLFVLTGLNVLWALAIAALSQVYLRVRDRRRTPERV